MRYRDSMRVAARWLYAGCAIFPASHAFATVAVPFERNDGQYDPRVAFAARSALANVFVTSDGRIVYSVRDPACATHACGWSLVESFAQARVSHPRGAERSTTRVSAFLGVDTRRWRSDIATFDRVRVGEPWRGIAVDLAMRSRNVEKIYTLGAGVDADRIRMTVDGASRLRTDASGALIAETARGDIAFTSPVAYQMIDGVRRAVDVRYRLTGTRTYSFALGAHDAHTPTEIDPLVRATFAGGDHVDDAYAIAIDADTGDVVVAGRTNSANFPGVSGGAQAALASSGFEDAFVARYSPDLTTLIQATYLGGSANDEAAALAIDPSTGDIVITGFTYSKDFPGTAGGALPNPPDPTPNTQGAYVARLSSDLTTLLQATYLGGVKSPQPMAVAIGTAGLVYVAGNTGNDFPADGAQTTATAGTHAFIAQLTGDLTTVQHATYMAGTGNETDNAGLAIDPNNGDVVLGGRTESIDLPGTAGGARSSSGGNTDFYLARFSPALNTLRGATYLGGSMVEEYIGGVIIEPVSSDIFVTGETTSGDFPGTTGGYQSSFAGAGNLSIVVARLDSTLGTLRQATYLGVDGNSYGSALALDAKSGDVFIAGQTSSHAFPGIAFAWQPTLLGSSDVIVARLSPDLTALRQSTYLGSAQDNAAHALAISSVNNDVYVAGTTTANAFPGTATGAQPAPGSPNGEDGFVARITRDLKEGVFAASFEP